MPREHIQHALDVIYKQIFNQGRVDLLPGLVSGPYIQHNPPFPNGLDGIMAYIKQAGSIPCEVKRVAIDGDLAFVHLRYLNWAGKETAGVEIFRFDGEARSSSIGMSFNPSRPPPTTATRCSDKNPARQKVQEFRKRSLD
jgi:predicted SnoaL-like aldol condensation-catalyzing enzyme